MRTYKWHVLMLLVLFIFAGRRLYADFRAGYYTPAGPETIRQMLPNITSADATYDAGQYPIYEPDLAPGDGKQELETYCSTCHTPRYVTMQPPLPADTWVQEVDKMRKTFGASVPDNEAQRIIQYLQAHYTPETRKQ